MTYLLQELLDIIAFKQLHALYYTFFNDHQREV